MRRLLRALSKLGLLGVVATLAYKLVQRRSSAPPTAGAPAWPPLPVTDELPSTVASNGATRPVSDDDAATVDTPPTTWVEPEDETCPASHPVKAKLSSGVFHLPGMMHYDRTKPDRCYPDPASAEADGLRQAKR